MRPETKKFKKSYRNILIISGIISEDFSFCQKRNEKVYYETLLMVKRPNDSREDYIPVKIPETTISELNLKKGDHVFIYGELDSRRKKDDKRKWELYVYPKKIKVLDKSNIVYKNKVLLEAELFETMCFRRELFEYKITFKLGLVNGGKIANIIPLVISRRKVNDMTMAYPGTKLKVVGKIQSREWMSSWGKEKTYAIEVMAEEVKKI